MSVCCPVVGFYDFYRVKNVNLSLIVEDLVQSPLNQDQSQKINGRIDAAKY